MAIDGTIENLADTPELVAYFGRHLGSRGYSDFPQSQIVYLSECSTHTICDVGIWPAHTSERTCSLRLLLSTFPGMLVTVNRGLISYELFDNTVNKRGAHILARVRAHWTPKTVKHLRDRTCLAYIYTSDYRRNKAKERILGRVITYNINDPQRPSHDVIHRLITSQLEPETAPTHD